MYSHDKMIKAFVTTALWDVVLRKMSEGRLHFWGVENMKWVRVLKPYFEKHTLLSAALVAGFVGGVAYAIISKTSHKMSRIQTAVWTFAVSGMLGIPMRLSGLFPHLKRFYYDELGWKYSFLTDAFSGIVVGCTMMAFDPRH